MRRRVAIVLVAVVAVALGLSWSSLFGPVSLLTGVDSCWAGGSSESAGGLLTADPVYGTSINGRAVMWPIGYSARHAGFEVAVLNAAGNVVATTGRVYVFSQARIGNPTTPTLGAILASADCGYLWSFIDCTAVAQATGDAAPNSDLGQQRSYCGLVPRS